MIKSDFLKMVKENEKSVICLDFDGVIYKNSKGFVDGTLYDEPVDEALESLKTLYQKGFQIILHSCKCNPERPLVNGLNGKELIRNWLKKYDVSHTVSDIVHIKPNAVVYIDDKGLRFENWANTMNELKRYKLL
jgi:ribonucleotide monophosphatase NagD (HAD superfamily)